VRVGKNNQNAPDVVIQGELVGSGGYDVAAPQDISNITAALHCKIASVSEDQRQRLKELFGIEALIISGELAEAEDLVLTIHSNPDQQIRAETVVSTHSPYVARGTIAVTDFLLPELLESPLCGMLSAEGSFFLPLTDLTNGTADLVIAELKAGCSQDILGLGQPARFVLDNEELRGAIELVSHEGARQNMLNIQGSAGRERFQVEARGNLSLQTISPLVSQVTNLRGAIALTLQAGGPYDNTVVAGNAAMNDGGFILPEPPVDVRHFNGSFDLNSNGELEGKIVGVVNSGTVTLSTLGNINAVESAQADLRFHNIHYSPVKNAQVVLGGELAIEQLVSPVRLSGDIEVQDAFYETEIGITTLVTQLREILGGVFNRTTPLTETPAKQSNEGTGVLRTDTDDQQLILDIEVTRTGEVRFASNFAVATLSPQLSITGTPEQMVLDGNIFLESGWFALGRHRFTLTSGAVSFSQGAGEPLLEIRGQTAVVTKSYERVQIDVLISGPASDPRVEFTSTSGLSQRDILQLITAGGGESLLQSALGRATVDVLGQDSIAGQLGDLTPIDKLSVRPEYSAESGAIAPRITAQKKITPRIEIESSTLLGEGDAPATVTGRYRLSENWSAETALTTASASGEQSSYAGVRYEIIRSQDRIDFFIEGAESIDEEEIRRRLAISEFSRFQLGELANVEEEILAFYVERGFRQAKIKVACAVLLNELCLSVKVEITEGQPTRIEGIQLHGDIPEPLESKLEQALKRFLGQPASEESRIDAQEELIEVLRRQSYPSAFARLQLRSKDRMRAPVQQNSGESAQVLLEAYVEAGARLAVRLSGNKEFTTEDLLKEAKFYSQQIPFGERVAETLSQRIQDIYRDNGFIAATTKHHCTQEQAVSSCEIQIHEGKQLKISTAVFEFDSTALSERILELARAQGPLSQSELQERVQILERELIFAGYRSPAVRYRIGEERNGEATLYFQADLGEQRTAERLRIETQNDTELPEDTPEQPSVLSYPQLIDFAHDLRTFLQQSGYQSAETSLDFSEKEAVITAALGEQTRIGSITISGNDRVSEQAIRRISRLQSGDTYTKEAIQTARQWLYRMGRFRDVRISEATGKSALGEQDLNIEVVELGPRELTIGGGYDSTYGVRATIDGVERTLFDSSGTIRAFADLYYALDNAEFSRGGLNFSYIDPIFLNQDIRFSETLAYLNSTRTEQEFELSRVSLSTLFQRNLTERLQFGIGHNFLFDDLQDVSPDAVLSRFDTGDVFLSILSGTATYDSTDRPLNPRSGLRLALNTKLATSAVGSEADYFAAEPSVRWLYPVNDLPFSFQLGGTFGWAREFNDSSQIPITQRYYLGGADSVRGFRENSLGPRGGAGSVLGGNTLYSGSLQLNYFITDSIDIHTFYDVGRLWLVGGPNDSQRESAGLGARFASPVGPISLDVGFPLDRRSGENAARIHFSLGATF
jgi:outer membrane protein assembly factor BamA